MNRPGALQPAKRPRVLFITDFYIEPLLAGVAAYARQAGWDLNPNMRFHGLMPNDTAADGILATVASQTRVRDCLARWDRCPVVRMLSTEFALSYPSVEIDYAAAGRAGARHLLDLGHVHYAFYWAQNSPDTFEVRDGFVGELARAGHRARLLNFPAAHPASDPKDLDRKERCRWLAAELRQLPTPLAVMGDDDRRGLELIAACEVAGLRVPEDVTVLGCDNHAIEQKLSPLPLSSVDVNHEGAGHAAALLLDRLMRGEPAPADPIKVAPRGVIARNSTATFVTDSPGITAAVLYLREHFPEHLRIDDLARLAGLSRRKFDSEFRRRVGRSAGDEIQRVRLACAARLLRDTDLKLAAIAAESGLGSASHLCRAFFEVYDVSPNAWREQVQGRPSLGPFPNPVAG